MIIWSLFATLIGGAGYQYGNSPFIKYSEVLLDSITHELRFDSGPVPLGQAIVNAKRAYIHGGMNGIDEKALAQIDQAVEFGKEHAVHVNINFHRAPGYCVNPPKEPLDLWSSEEALKACAFHWAHFARRYKGIPSSQVSFVAAK